MIFFWQLGPRVRDRRNIRWVRVATISIRLCVGEQPIFVFCCCGLGLFEEVAHLDNTIKQ